jgi:hypothetical protein
LPVARCELSGNSQAKKFVKPRKILIEFSNFDKKKGEMNIEARKI